MLPKTSISYIFEIANALIKDYDKNLIDEKEFLKSNAELIVHLKNYLLINKPIGIEKNEQIEQLTNLLNKIEIINSCE